MPAPLSALAAEAEDLLPRLVEIRRRIHANPELGLVLPETQRTVLEGLDGLGLEVATGGRTSAVVATLRGARPGPTILLRADMDALPMPEDTGLEFASTREGAMHACGHDAHVAMLLGAARLLAGRRAEIAGNVRFLFQPGEEGHAGARILVEEGLLEREPRTDAAFAIHVDSTLPCGSVGLRPGPILAAGDVFSVDLHGRGGHASMPHLAADPIPVACEIVSALQAFVTRRIDAFDPIVITVTRIQAGTTSNVIPESAHLLGTIRSVSPKARELAREGLRRVVAGVASAHGCEAKVHVLPGYPVTVNDAGFAGFVRAVSSDLAGPPAVIDMRAPIMGAEDFSYILERVPGALVFLGARPPEGPAVPLHSNRMRIDERAMAAGTALHAAVALRWLETGHEAHA
jgi:hippurate hydrolase